MIKITRHHITIGNTQYYNYWPNRLYWKIANAFTVLTGRCPECYSRRPHHKFSCYREFRRRK